MTQMLHLPHVGMLYETTPRIFVVDTSDNDNKDTFSSLVNDFNHYPNAQFVFVFYPMPVAAKRHVYAIRYISTKFTY